MSLPCRLLLHREPVVFHPFTQWAEAETMAWKKLTFILIPHSQSHVKQVTVPRRILLGMIAFLVVAIAVMIFYIIGFSQKSYLLSDSREIQQQNAILEGIVTGLDSSLTVLNTKIDSIETLAELTRKEARISDLDLKLNNSMNITFSQSGVDMPLQRILSYVDRLEERSTVFEMNFTSLFDQCMSDTFVMKYVPSIRPSEGFITSEFQFLNREEDLSLTQKSQPGVSITNSEGTPIVATADGVVESVRFSNELGRYIVIDHGGMYQTRYTHLMQKGITVKRGDTVTRGQTIALMGRTGISIKAVAPHVMYSIEHHGKFVNPIDYFLVANAAGADSTGETPDVQTQ